MTATMLYRFFDESGCLLYVGISTVGPSRWKSHSKEKPWWTDVASSTVKHFTTRQAAESAEISAIKSEYPVHNKMHAVTNDTHNQYAPNVHHFNHRRDLGELGDRATKLWLSPEIAYEPCVDYIWDEPGEIQFWYWVEKVQTNYPDEYASNTVPIAWFVEGDGIFERAPWNERTYESKDFLDYFTWPIDRDGYKINWFNLEVRHNRFPEFAEALAWTPSALQPNCPLRSIVESKRGMYPTKIDDYGRLRKVYQ